MIDEYNSTPQNFSEELIKLFPLITFKGREARPHPTGIGKKLFRYYDTMTRFIKEVESGGGIFVLFADMYLDDHRGTTIVPPRKKSK